MKILPAAVLIACMPLPLHAHHSFSSSFDRSMPVKVTGTITKVEWKNPHIWFFVDVKNPDGTVTNWGFEGNPPGTLQRLGITKDRMRLGDTIIVEGFRTRDGSDNGYGQKVTFADGRSVHGVDGPGGGGDAGAGGGGGSGAGPRPPQ